LFFSQNTRLSLKALKTGRYEGGTELVFFSFFLWALFLFLPAGVWPSLSQSKLQFLSSLRRLACREVYESTLPVVLNAAAIALVFSAFRQAIEFGPAVIPGCPLSYPSLWLFDESYVHPFGRETARKENWTSGFLFFFHQLRSIVLSRASRGLCTPLFSTPGHKAGICFFFELVPLPVPPDLRAPCDARRSLCLFQLPVSLFSFFTAPYFPLLRREGFLQ